MTEYLLTPKEINLIASKAAMNPYPAILQAVAMSQLERCDIPTRQREAYDEGYRKAVRDNTDCNTRLWNNVKRDAVEMVFERIDKERDMYYEGYVVLKTMDLPLLKAEILGKIGGSDR